MTDFQPLHVEDMVPVMISSIVGIAAAFAVAAALPETVVDVVALTALAVTLSVAVLWAGKQITAAVIHTISRYKHEQ